MSPQELQTCWTDLRSPGLRGNRHGKTLLRSAGGLKDTTGIELPPPARKTIDLEGRLVKDGVKKALRDRQLTLAELVHAIRQFRKIADSKPLTLQGGDYAQAVQELNKAIDRAEGPLLR